MKLPIFITQIKDLSLMQTKWKSILDPFLSSPTNSMIILPQVKLSIGSNSINHRLGEKLQGWTILRKRAACNIYDTQDSNQTPQLTLQLVSDVAVTVDLGVF